MFPIVFEKIMILVHFSLHFSHSLRKAVAFFNAMCYNTDGWEKRICSCSLRISAVFCAGLYENCIESNKIL